VTSDKQNYGGKAVNASIWLLSGVMFSRLVNLAMTVALARLLVPADFGLVALGTTLLAILTAITDLSLANALIHHKELKRTDFDTAFTLSAIRGFVLASVMIGAGFVMADIYQDDRLIWVCCALGLRPLLSGLGSPRYVTYSKELNFKVVAFQEAMNYTAQFLVSVAIAYYTASYWAIVGGNVVAALVGIVLVYWQAPYRPRISFAATGKILSFSIWVTLSQVLMIIGNRFDNFLAGGVLGMSTFGAYNVGNTTTATITQSAIQPLERVLFPSFSKIVDDRKRLQVAFQKSQASLFSVGMPTGVGLALVAEPFVYLVLGPNWMIAATVMQFIAPVLGIQIVFGPTNAISYALGATRLLFMRNLILFPLRVAVVFSGLYYYGLVGLLVARVISGGLFVTLMNFYLVRKLTGLSVSAQCIVTWRAWVAGAAMTCCALSMRYYLGPITNNMDATVSLLLTVIVGGVSYCAVHTALWFLSGRSPIGIEAEIAKILSKVWKRIAA
jgi:PST family polysaccharide transporter